MCTVEGHIESTKLLLESGADVNCQSKNKTTPLHYASKLGDTKIVGMLIQNGANVNVENHKRFTPLHFSSAYGQSDIVKMLLDYNICLTVKNNYGKTALDIAKEKNHKKIYRMIYEKMIELMSSKNATQECVKEDCQKEMKRMILDKVDDTFVSKEGKSCVVCYDERNGTFVLQPCGHAKTCEKCCNKIVRETKKCPLCRETVAKYQKIYD